MVYRQPLILMAKYRKKPVVIEAIQWNGENDLDIESFLNGSEAYNVYSDGKVTAIIISTLEGQMSAQIGDWIIKGVNGEFYPCKPDIFEKTYTPEFDFIDRIAEEKSQLDDRMEKLAAFINTEKFNSLEMRVRLLMVEQHEVMSRYSVILDKRLKLLNKIKERDTV